MRIGIITMHRVINYGSVLQAFALQEIIERLGHKCQIIDYIYPNEYQYSRGLLKEKKNLHYYLSKIRGKAPRWKKERLFHIFWKEHLKLSKTYKSYNSIHKKPPKYDLYITGSDQVWNTRWMKGDSTFLLSFVNDKPKISYSASFASDCLDIHYIDIFRKWLSCYKFIGVRESNSVSFVKELTGKNASITLDPTLLLTANEWIKLASPKSFCKDKYILLFMLNYSRDFSETIFKTIDIVHHNTGLKVISIGDYPWKYKNKEIITSFNVFSPHDFISFFRDATYIITSSFHGTAFAVNFGKPFLTMVDNNKDDGRISTLLKNLGLEKNMVTEETNLNIINGYVNVEEEQIALSKLRANSLLFLKTSIIKATS